MGLFQFCCLFPVAAVENKLSQESYKLAAARLQGEIERMQWVERSTAIRADWEVKMVTTLVKMVTILVKMLRF